jgi:hypothetical protein
MSDDIILDDGSEQKIRLNLYIHNLLSQSCAKSYDNIPPR